MPQRILLVRHGRSAHVHAGAIDVEGFRRWREAYEAAGIDERDEPPPELRALASSMSIIVASQAPRASQSAKLLNPHVATSELLHELELAPPNLRCLRMPLPIWAIAYGMRRLIRPHVSPLDVQRAQDAADWLSDLAERHDSVLAVTHASFRSLLSQRLIEQGWRCESRTSRTGHWSVWSFSRP